MRKILAFFLALLISVSVVAGCGSDKAPAKDNSAQGTQVTTSAQKPSKQNIDTRGNDKKLKISESVAYTDKEHVAAYINEYKHLPHNYITKKKPRSWAGRPRTPWIRLLRASLLAATATATTRRSCRIKMDAAGGNAILIMSRGTGIRNVLCSRMTA